MITYISSKSNRVFKSIQKLLSSRRERKLQDSFIVEGLRIVREAININCVKYIVLSEYDFERGKFDDFKEALADIYVLSDELFMEISDTVNSQGILALCKKSVLEFNKQKPAIILDRLQDPGNLGTIIRTADAFGLNQVVLMKGTVDFYNPKVLRATMGSCFRVSVFEEVEFSSLRKLLGDDIKLYAAELGAECSINELNFDVPFALIIGNEGEGVSEELSSLVDEHYEIKMKGYAESLNAAVAASISIYEAMK